MQKQLEPIATRRARVMSAIYIMTAASVLLGTLHYDMTIALSNAVVGLLTSLLEYQRLGTMVVTLNNTIRDLHHLMIWWDSLSFVEKRMAVNKNR